MNPQTNNQPNNSAQVPPAHDDTKIMSGSPGGNMPSASPGANAPSGQPSPSPSFGGSPPASSAPQASGGSAPLKEYFLGDRKFSSADELAAYASTLKPKADMADRLMTQLQPPAQTKDEMDVLSEMIYEDPKKALMGVVEIAKRQLNEESRIKETGENTKKVFYNTYADLVGQEDIVSLEWQKLQHSYAQAGKTLDQVPIEEVSSKIANAARDRIARIRGQNVSDRKELPNGNPVVVGSGSGAPLAPTQQNAPKTMFEQMRDMRAQKGKAVRH